MQHISSFKQKLQKDRFSISKFLAIVPAIGILIGFLGFCIHFAGNYRSTGVPRYSNEFLGVWLAFYSILIASMSLYILLRSASFWPILSNKSIWIIIFFVFLSDILGFAIFVSDLYAKENLSIWCLTWMAYSTITIIYLYIQVKNDKENPPPEEESPKRNRAARCGICCGKICGWILFVVATFFIFLLAYQAISLGSDYGRFPPLGELYEIEGEVEGSFKLHIYCTGPEGAPVTYLFEHGGGACSTSFLALQDALTNEYNKRVCVYDRAGYGWSHMGELPRTSQRVMRELHQLLEKAGETGPFVLIGHSVGGQMVQVYAGLYPSDVLALVIVDSYPDYLNITAPAYGWSASTIQSFKEQTLRVIDIYRGMGIPLGITRWFVGGSADYVPEDKQAMNKAMYGTLRNWNAQYWDFRNGVENPESEEITTSVGNKPVIFIPAGDTVNKTCQEEGLAEGSAKCTEQLEVRSLYYQSALAQAARLSTNSTVVVCPYPCAHSMVYDKVYYRFVLDRILSLGL